MKILTSTFAVLTAMLAFAGAITTESVKIDVTTELRQSLGSSDEVSIYEGLPHHSSEAAQLEKEKKRQDTTEIGGFPFYTPKVAATAEVGKALKEILADESNLAAFTGEKRCGGFHPDYGVAWSAAGTENAVLICYGCSEVLFVAGDKTYRYDLKGDALPKLKKLLSAFHSKRPDKLKG